MVWNVQKGWPKCGKKLYKNIKQQQHQTKNIKQQKTSNNKKHQTTTSFEDPSIESKAQSRGQTPRVKLFNGTLAICKPGTWRILKLFDALVRKKSKMAKKCSGCNGSVRRRHRHSAGRSCRFFIVSPKASTQRGSENILLDPREGITSFDIARMTCTPYGNGNTEQSSSASRSRENPLGVASRIYFISFSMACLWTVIWCHLMSFV